MKVIDLLNKIANNEKIPQQIMFRGLVYYFDGSGYFHNEDEITSEEAFLEGIRTDMVLNEEIEIIEEDKEISEIVIDKDDEFLKTTADMNYYAHFGKTDVLLATKINELIIAMNRLRKEKK